MASTEGTTPLETSRRRSELKAINGRKKHASKNKSTSKNTSKKHGSLSKVHPGGKCTRDKENNTKHRHKGAMHSLKKKGEVNRQKDGQKTQQQPSNLTDLASCDSRSTVRNRGSPRAHGGRSSQTLHGPPSQILQGPSSQRTLLCPLSQPKAVSQPKAKVPLLQKTGTASVFENVAASRTSQTEQGLSSFVCSCFAKPLVGFKKESPLGHAIDALSLAQKDLVKLRALYDTIDAGAKGSITNPEFITHIQEKNSIYTKSVFRHLALECSDEEDDDEGKGQDTLVWEEFCRIVISFCAFTEEDILSFVFHSHDEDQSGHIDADEFISIARGVHDAKELTSAHTDEITLATFDLNGDEKLGLKEFISINQRFPLVFFPAFRLQDKVRRRTLGLARWESVMKQFNEQQEARQAQMELDAASRRYSIRQQERAAQSKY
jgi:Ca2+-binding EF-hand superfamily protein